MDVRQITQSKMLRLPTSFSACWLAASLFHAAILLPDNTYGLLIKVPSNRAHLIGYRSGQTLSSSATVDDEVLGGVSEFERWFASVPGSQCASEVVHSAFQNLRGLAYNSKQPPASDVLCRVPRSVVLQSDFGQPDWDATLAAQLWEEVSKGSESEKYGYCKLLTRSWSPEDGGIPGYVAPDALRHWTKEELEWLESTGAGRKLIELQNMQESQWMEKYKAMNTKISWEQFAWAMEVVHSRAFKGEFGDGSAIPPLVSGAAPIVAAVAGYAYLFPYQGDDNLVLAGLAILAAAPIVANTLSAGKASAVLLPLIDSANHKESADSSIDYDPLTKSFALTVGPKCFVEEENQIQLYISYGAKKDSELMLNYGFLDESGASPDRRVLADTFNRRNG